MTDTLYDSGYRLVLTACPDQASAEDLARCLVEGRLAACVNILPGVRSVYRWQDAVQSDDELLLIIKTRADGVQSLIRVVQERHPYELPEVVSVPIDTGLGQYLGWINASVNS